MSSQTCPTCGKSLPESEITVCERKIYGTRSPTFIVDYICEGCLRKKSKPARQPELAQVIYEPAPKPAIKTAGGDAPRGQMNLF